MRRTVDLVALQSRLRAIAIGVALLAYAAIACADNEPPLSVQRHIVVTGDNPASGGAAPPTHLMRLHLAVMHASGWDAQVVLDSARDAMKILSQCSIRATSIELHEIDGPPRYRSLFTPVSRELARRLGLPKPTVFFVADTLNRPAFDAEAIGRGNSRTRPEMADTVWIASGTRDLPIVIAHELAHVLADSGEHSEVAGNLMQEDTAPGSTRLTPAQCGAIVDTATANGLLQTAKPSR